VKNILTVLTAIIVTLFFSSSLIAQDSTQTKKTNRGKNKTSVEQKTKLKHGVGFVDANGDGYNDGDGIPNGLDEDYVKGSARKGFVDEDGDGINDNAGLGRGKGNRAKFGFHNNGAAGQGTGMQDGSGNVSGNGNGQGGNSKGNTAKGKGKGGN
jgi:hypothetical protein